MATSVGDGWITFDVNDERFESLLLAPTIILGTPIAAGLNQKNSTSLSLGTQTAFDF
jgi:hypothetical protein